MHIIGERIKPPTVVVSMDLFYVYVHVHVTSTRHCTYCNVYVHNYIFRQIGSLAWLGGLAPLANNALHSPSKLLQMTCVCLLHCYRIFYMFEAAWDSSLHNSVLLNRSIPLQYRTACINHPGTNLPTQLVVYHSTIGYSLHFVTHHLHGLHGLGCTY